MKKNFSIILISIIDFICFSALGTGIILLAVWAVKNLEIYRIIKMALIPILLYIGISIIQTGLDLLKKGIKKAKK